MTTKMFDTPVDISVRDLMLDCKNIRFGHLGTSLTETQIEEHLWEEEDCRVLYKQIVRDRQVYQPLYVKKYETPTGTKTEPVFRQIRDAVQIYKKPENEIQGIPKDWVYTPVDISVWQNNQLKKIQITTDDNMVLKIPDSPNPLGKKIPEEDDDTWIYEDEPLVRYALYEDVEPSNGSSNRKGQLVSFLDPENLHYVALNYVRHRIMRPLAVFDFISRDIE